MTNSLDEKVEAWKSVVSLKTALQYVYTMGGDEKEYEIRAAEERYRQKYGEPLNFNTGPTS